MAEWIKLDTRTITLAPTKVKEFYTIAQANSFEELKEIMPRLEVPKGERVRFVMQLKMPVAPAFDLAGAELIFRPMMPEGLDLIDVYGEGWTTVVVEAESDPVFLPAVGVFLAANWKLLTLGAIGIALALGFLIISVAILVTATIAPEVFPKIFKWLAVGLGGLAVVGLLLAARKKGG